MARRPKLFIGSSSEGEKVALAIQQNLFKVADVTVWSQGAFGLSESNLEALVRAADTYDFAVLVLTQDDLRARSDQIQAVPRDNVLFELGLFMGKLGRARTFIVFDGEKKPTLPTDLAGVTAAQYRSFEDGGHLQAEVGPAASLIRSSVESLGPVPAVSLDGHPLSKEIEGIAAATADAFNLGYKPFEREIEANVEDWLGQARNWASRRFVVRENYTTLLEGIYRSAKTEIFSTSVPSYLGYWDTTQGSIILNSQKGNNSAKSTRVFILRSPEDMTPELQKVLKRHLNHKVSVYLFFEDKLGATPAGMVTPPDVGNDWTLVDDGDVIGVTRNFGDLWEAEWLVKVPGERERFLGYKQRLLAASRPFHG
jgi:hypothetical protein